MIQTSQPTRPKKRRFLRFSLLGLLVAVTVVNIWLAVEVRLSRPPRHQGEQTGV